MTSYPDIFSLATALVVSALLLVACTGRDPEVTNATQCVAPGGVVGLAATRSTLDAPVVYREERSRVVALDAFDMDRTEVTNAQFRAFVEATDYVTTAEKPQPSVGQPGGGVFRPPTATNPSWWHFVEGATWRSPEGPDSTVDGLDSHPVVQVSHADAVAYARWSGRALPSEDQWEYAAQGEASTLYPWGDDRVVDGREQANSWQGAFPLHDNASDGYAGRSPVGCFPANAFGLYDMIGNVWEWTDTPYAAAGQTSGYTIKGGSFLCAPNYCRRYRVPARQSQEADFSTNHIGFRTVSAP